MKRKTNKNNSAAGSKRNLAGGFWSAGFMKTGEGFLL
jgi:hypothetical protein